MKFNIQHRKFTNPNVGVLGLGSNQAGIILNVEWKNDGREVNNMYLQAFDTDDTLVFTSLPQPTDPELEGRGFATGTFQLLRPIGPNTIAAIKEGRYPGRAGFASLHQLGIGSEGTKGVGQSPPCGVGAVEFNKDIIAGQVEDMLKKFIEKRHVDASVEGQQITLYLLHSEYGGTSSGGREKFRLILQDCIERLGLNVVVFELIIVPDTATTKDWPQTASVCFSGLAEISAAATGSFYTVQHLASDSEPRIYTVPHGRTILIANNNDALHKPLATDRIRQTSFIANLIHLVSTSDVGSQLLKELLDFDDDAAKPTASGELRWVKSFGMSSITLNRQRLILHHVAKVEELACGRLLQEKPVEVISVLAEAFFHQQHLLEGEGFNQVSDTLLRFPHTNGTQRPVSLIDRTRQLILQNLNGQVGMDAINAARAAINHSAEILETFANHVEENTRSRSNEISEAFNTHCRNIIRNSDYGYRTALDFGGRVNLMLQQVKTATSNEIADLDHELEQQRNAVNQFQNDLVPEVENKGLIWKWINRDHLRHLASNGCLAVANATSLELRLAAKQRVLTLCDGVGEHVAKRIAELTELVTIVETFGSEGQKTREYEENLDDVDVCPSGHSLVSRENINAYYERAVASTSTREFAEAEKQLILQLLQVFHQRLPDPFILRDNPNALGALTEVAFERFSQFINNINVVDELLKERPIGTEALRSYLLERAREAEPALRLKDNDVHDNPQHFINIFAIKGGAANPLVTELNTYGTQKRPYMAIDTQDPDAIVLLSVRSTFPVSDIVAFENWKKAYFETAKQLKEEQFHRAMWRRFIPLPGAKVTAEDARRYVAMAFVLGRLIRQVRGEAANLQYAQFDRNRPETVENCRLVTLGGTIEEIQSYFQAHYPLLVEIFSVYYEVFFQLKGAQWLEKRLLDLDSQIGSADTITPTSLVASLIDHETIKELLKRVDWLVDQTTPQAMYYYKN